MHAHRYIPHVCVPHTSHAHMCTTHIPHTRAYHTCVNHTHTHTCTHSPPCKPSCSPPNAVTQPTPFLTFTQVPHQPESAGTSVSSEGCDHAGHLLGAPLNRELIPRPLAAGPAIHTPPCSPLAALCPPIRPSVHLTLLQPTPARAHHPLLPPWEGLPVLLQHPPHLPPCHTPGRLLSATVTWHVGVHLFITVASAPIPPLPTGMQPWKPGGASRN